jgi:plasmid stability protein
VELELVRARSGNVSARGYRNGRSMEAEARIILSNAVRDPEPTDIRGLGLDLINPWDGA